MTKIERKGRSMEQFTNWLEKKDPELCEGIGILRIVKQMIPGGGMAIMKATRGMMGGGEGGCGCQPKDQKIKGTGPDKASALKNALEKLDMEPEDVELVDKENDVYTFKVKM
jgi:hypothetical protein